MVSAEALQNYPSNLKKMLIFFFPNNSIHLLKIYTILHKNVYCINIKYSNLFFFPISCGSIRWDVLQGSLNSIHYMLPWVNVLDISSMAPFHACCLFVGGRNASVTHLPHAIAHNYLMRPFICVCVCLKKLCHALDVVHTQAFLLGVIPQQPIHPYHTVHPTLISQSTRAAHSSVVIS